MFHVPHQYRLRTHPQLGTTDAVGNNGAFEIPLFENTLRVFVIASDGREVEPQHRWEHVSVSRAGFHRTTPPTWEVMVRIKQMFWDDEDCVIQFHPPRSQYVNRHPGVLHLWRPVFLVVPLPSRDFV